jgi:hypothetical protein
MSMPRRLLGSLSGAALSAALVAAALLLPTPAATADPNPRPNPVLDRVDNIFAGEIGPAEAGLDASLALRDVFVARPTLADTDQWRAGLLLARPTDRAKDPYGDGYRARSTRICRGRVCVHYVRTTRDAPPTEAWPRTTLRVMHRVWRTEVGRLGFRAPPSDGRHGGDDRFDVYLKELGSLGLYGYCAPEYRVPGERHVASGYCVLDDDFARSQYHANPKVSLRVTAAHEFFHAIQFGYDFREDPWLLESTATWMEELVADGADDNRRYLPYGQVVRPGTSLDIFDPGGYHQYGNWAFWQYLGERLGNDVVREVWRQAGAYDGAPDRFSVAALRRALERHGGLPATFAAYAAATTDPERAFDEGAAWPSAKRPQAGRLGPANRRARTSVRINHLASRTLAFRPTRGLRGQRWRLELTVNAPPRKTGPAAYVQVLRRDGTVRSRAITLNADGFGRERARFDARVVRRVSITLANGSTRYRCGTGDQTFACAGRPVDQQLRFEVGARVTDRRSSSR